jgi:hypothetical protein
LSAYGSFFAVEHDVEFDVFAAAGVFPGVFTVFHFLFSPFVLCGVALRLLLLRRFAKRPLGAVGRGWLK